MNDEQDRRADDHMGYPPIHDFDERYSPRTEFSYFYRQINDRLGDIHEDVTEIKAQVKATNGRVTALEIWKAGVLGAQKALSFIPAVALSVTAAVLTYVLTH